MEPRVLARHWDSFARCRAAGATRVVTVGVEPQLNAALARAIRSNTKGRRGFLLCANLDVGALADAWALASREGVEDMLRLISGDARRTLRSLTEPIDLLCLGCSYDVALDVIEIVRDSLTPQAQTLRCVAGRPVLGPLLPAAARLRVA